VEEGWTDNEVAEMTVKAYLGSLKQSGIDTLILGCTHYPLLKKAIHNLMGNGVRLVDSAEETAKEVESVLKKGALIRKSGKGVHSFFVTDAPDRFIKVGRASLVRKWSRPCASNARRASVATRGWNRRSQSCILVVSRS
jgi:glutamate racemase